VGYGDYYPVTPGGQMTAIFIMIAGVGIIGVLASLMSSLLIGQSAAPVEEPPKVVPMVAVDQELAVIKEKLTGIESELAALRQMLGK
jgi:voltage-gated potassium channel